MSLPLPRCAWCGGSLKDRDVRKRAHKPDCDCRNCHSATATIRIKVDRYLGKPEVGWHDDCRQKDPLVKGLERGFDSLAVVREVAKRDQSTGARVSAGKAFWKS